MAYEDIDYTIVPDDNYVAAVYAAPKVVLDVGNFVEGVIVGRDIETPNSVLAFVSGDRDHQVEYIEGLIGIGTFLSCLISIWFLALLLIKCQGRERMGCAAGHAFHDSESDDRAVVEERKRRGGASGTLFRGDDEDVSVGAAVDPDDSVARDDRPRKERSSRKPSKRSSRFTSGFAFGKKNNEPSDAKASSDTKPESYIYDGRATDEIELHMELDNIVQSATRESENRRNTRSSPGEPWTLYSIPKAVQIGDESVKSRDESTNDRTSEKFWGQSCMCSPEPHHVQRRKFLTRSVFALFAVISLMSCLLLITNMYKPLESSALTSSEVVQETAQIVDELDDVLEVLDDVTAATIETIDSTPLDYDVLCPGFPVEDFESQFGFNPQTMIATVSSEYQTYVPTIARSLATAKDTIDSVTGMLVDINSSISTANKYLWIVPLVICITMLIIFSQLALMLAVIYREEKFKDIQTTVPKVENCYAWTVLPLQVIVVLVSWLLVIVFCFGMILTTDSCVPSFSSAGIDVNNGRGTPDDVVLAVLDQYMVSSNTDQAVVDVAQQRLATYITGCGGRAGDSSLQNNDPLAEVIVLQGLLQESIDEVNTQLSFANDVLGLQFIERECGPGNQVGKFFGNLTVLNGKFSNVIKAIKDGYDALSCPRVNALYVKTVHEAFCTDFATANASGLVLLIMISVSSMVLITLRASWRSAE